MFKSRLDSERPDLSKNDPPPAPASSDAPPAPAPFWQRKFHITRPRLSVIGGALLVGWVIWWSSSFSEGKLARGRDMWVPEWTFLGVDFQHNYLASRLWLEGGNPYREDFGGAVNVRFTYPPLVLALFAWCRFLSFERAFVVWALSIALIVVVATFACLKTRAELGLRPVPPAFAVAAMLLSTPVVFAMERGNCDAIVLLMVVVAAVALRRERASWAADIVIAVALTVAAYVKLYPAFIIPALLLFRRARAFWLTVGLCTVLGLVFFPYNLASVRNQQAIIDHGMHAGLFRFSHSLSGAWAPLWAKWDFPKIALIPGIFGAGVMLGGLAVWVSGWVNRARDRRLAFPYLLWCTAIMTFWTPVSYDYKLIFLPLAMLALWDVRNRPLVHMLSAPFLLYAQPFAMDVGKWPLLGIKVMALLGVSLALVETAKRLSGRAELARPMNRDDDPQGAVAPARYNA